MVNSMSKSSVKYTVDKQDKPKCLKLVVYNNIFSCFLFLAFIGI